MTVRIIHDDVLAGLAQIESDSVHCVVTSPPYWGAQRDYGVAGQIGMESTPEIFVDRLVAVFREVWRVLKVDGCLWLIIGDSYAASGKGGGGKLMLQRGHKWSHRAHLKGWRSPPEGYKQKDLVGVPWLLAKELRKDGWFLRRDVIWDKGSATEPSRLDRPSGSHEMLFLFARSLRYQFDASALPHGTVWSVRPSGYDGHPAAFPPKLVASCIRAGCPTGGTVLDPFGGSGTVGVVASQMQRRAILIELSAEYCEMARKRIEGDAPLFADLPEPEPAPEPAEQGGLFDEG